MPAFDRSISLNLLLKLKESKKYERRNHDLKCKVISFSYSKNDYDFKNNKVFQKRGTIIF